MGRKVDFCTSAFEAVFRVEAELEDPAGREGVRDMEVGLQYIPVPGEGDLNDTECSVTLPSVMLETLFRSNGQNLMDFFETIACEWALDNPPEVVD